jgi:predicted CXXCH cytochrome family protein
MNIWKMLIALLMCVFGIVVCAFNMTEASEKDLSVETKFCLQCHTKSGIDITFENNESFSVYVDPQSFKTSVHSFLQCSECHTGFSVDNHPKRRFKSLEQFKRRNSLICRRCHKDEHICDKTIHAGLLAKEKRGTSPVCSECHTAHAVMPIEGGKIFMSEKFYCYSCHGYDIKTTYKDGETVSMKIEVSVIDKSVHGMLSCTDCHFGFSSEEHPQRNFRTRRDYVIASSDNCRRCHFDKYSKTMESIHFSELRQGNQSAPVCTDCHGSHSIEHMHRERAIIAKRCRNCHGKIYDDYSRSVHGAALLNEANRDVPVCIDCHKAHDIRNPLTLEWHERIPDICSNCHADVRIMGKYGLSTNVVKSYLSDFHGVTLSLYKKQREAFDKPGRPIAVCTDCHGTHNIMSTMNRDTKEVKLNLMNKCKKCHEDITENFPDAWLSHYEPGIASASMVYIIDLLFSFFIPIMVIGLILQIILHIWRYSFNR